MESLTVGKGGKELSDKFLATPTLASPKSGIPVGGGTAGRSDMLLVNKDGGGVAAGIVLVSNGDGALSVGDLVTLTDIIGSAAGTLLGVGAANLASTVGS